MNVRKHTINHLMKKNFMKKLNVVVIVNQWRRGSSKIVWRLNCSWIMAKRLGIGPGMFIPGTHSISDLFSSFSIFLVSFLNLGLSSSLSDLFLFFIFRKTSFSPLDISSDSNDTAGECMSPPSLLTLPLFAFFSLLLFSFIVTQKRKPNAMPREGYYQMK